jgi:hypothetical protein
MSHVYDVMRLSLPDYAAILLQRRITGDRRPRDGYPERRTKNQGLQTWDWGLGTRKSIHRCAVGQGSLRQRGCTRFPARSEPGAASEAATKPGATADDADGPDGTIHRLRRSRRFRVRTSGAGEDEPQMSQITQMAQIHGPDSAEFRAGTRHLAAETRRERTAGNADEADCGLRLRSAACLVLLSQGRQQFLNCLDEGSGLFEHFPQPHRIRLGEILVVTLSARVEGRGKVVR